MRGRRAAGRQGVDQRHQETARGARDRFRPQVVAERIGAGQRGGHQPQAVEGQHAAREDALHGATERAMRGIPGPARLGGG